MLLGGVAPVTKHSSQLDDKPIRLGDEVIIFDKNAHPIKGIVRSIKKNVLGVEVVSC